MYDHPKREHDEHEIGRATEQQNAYAWSMMNKPPGDTNEIAELVAAGKFVVVCRHTDYCPYTDAIAGSREWIDGVFDTRKEAEDSLKRYVSGEHWDPDSDYYVFPRPSPPRPEVWTSRQDDEIPF